MVSIYTYNAVILIQMLKYKSFGMVVFKSDPILHSLFFYCSNIF